ncbi:hypothetical protein RN001_004256 [Aquatica leii]|uniref:Carboxylic ester hydrolase n=1 Tax=Aquatica leii TaxID=1421715 RepID=A0AAN7SHC9_9COLE|nr:hypothetical protein RN001_004256 [Aquatica leii]
MFSFLIVSLHLVTVITCLNLEVKLPLGSVNGHLSETWNGKQYIGFEGIPYATPPVGELRFEEPRVVERWDSVLEANRTYTCLQYDYSTNKVIGTEDCLYLNIYTWDINPKQLKNVIIHIHGGAFMYNNPAKYGPNIILDKDIVYVSFNYRLGILGFLSTEDEVLPGNLGLKDQTLALRWIKDHIEYFGGNPNSITLTGLSAGGASAQLHSLSPLSQGLFHRGISQSGSVLNPWVLSERSLEKSQQLGVYLNCPITSTKKLVACLKKKPAQNIIVSTKIFQPWLHNPFTPFGVVVDQWSPNPFLPKHLHVLLKSNKVQDLPWIFSNVDCEGLYPAADFIANLEYLKAIDKNWNKLIPHILDFNNTVSLRDQKNVVEKIRRFYFGNKPLLKNTFAILVQMMSDRLFTSGIEYAARLHSAAIKSPVYYYYFKYRGVHSKSEARSKSAANYGVAHGDDAIYILSTDINTQLTDSDKKMSFLLVDIWTTFANLTQSNINWLPVSKDINEDLNYLLIQSPTEVETMSAEFLGNRNFWSSLPLKENEKNVLVKDEL